MYSGPPHVDSPYVCFWASAAASTSLPADTVARLLDHDDNLVRITIAKTSPAPGRSGGLRLTGERSVLGELVKAVLERAPKAELTARLLSRRAC